MIIGNLDSLFEVAKFLMSNTNEKINTINKGISECGQVRAQNLMQSVFHINTVISGTAQFVRNIMIKSQVTALLGLGCLLLCFIQEIRSWREIFQPSEGTSSAIVDSFNNYLTCHHDTALDRIDGSVPAPSIEQREYTNIFYGNSTRYVYFQLEYAPPGRDLITTFDYLTKDGKGNIISNTSSLTEIKSNYDVYWTGYGWATPGNWAPGKYTYSVALGKSTPVTGTFEIKV